MINKPQPQKPSSKESDLINMLSQQVTLAPIPVILSMSTIAIMAAETVPTEQWALWLGLVFALQAVRWSVYRKLPTLTSISVANRLNIAVAINVINSVIHSLSFLFFPGFLPFERAVQSMLIVGMGVASVMTTVGYLPFTLAHILLGLLPMYALWTWSATLETGGLIEILVPIIGILYSFTLYAISRNIYKLYSKVYDQRRMLQGALDDAEKAGRAKTRFLASASHDLRQPIHSLSLFSASLARRELDQKSRDIVDHIGQAIRSLTLQMDGLLDISKLDANVITVVDETITLSMLLAHLTDEYRPSAIEKGLDMAFYCPEHAIIRTDPVLLERIISNLLSNAIKYSETGTITLTACANGNKWDLCVRDTGLGIPADQQDTIFEEFYQIDNQERNRDQGLGLGLAIVKRLAELLNLPLELKSELALGSSFTIQLPAGLRSTNVSSNTALTDAISLDSMTVLVVDDEAEIRLGMKEILESWDCTVLLAESTETAIAAVQSAQPKVALVDFRLRGDDNGIQTIQALRLLYPGLPGVLISGDTAPDRLRHANEAGITLIHKPVLPSILRRIVYDAYLSKDI
jgi:signal transduction histidine kinase/CheY-like chemotaxis protein